MKIRLVSIAIAILVVYAMLQITSATSPTPAIGTVTVTNFIPIQVRNVSGNTIIDFVQSANLVGTFTGTTTDIGTIIQYPTGDFNFKLRHTFTGTVNDKSGTMVIEVNGKGEGGVPGGNLQGQFVILSGTGELVNLHGYGNIDGIAGDGGTYSGQISFDSRKEK